MKEYKKLPELDILPVKPQKEVAQLRDNLIEYGYDPQNPILIWKGHDIIVDGNHRYDICREEGIEPSFLEEEFASIDEVKIYILKHYLQCEGRVKTPTQEATALLELKELVTKISQDAKERKWTGKQVDLTAPGREGAKGETTEVLAEIAGTGKKTIERVLRVQKQGVSELNEMMKNGKLSAKAAEDFVKNVPKHEQEKIVKEGGVDAVKSTVSKIREVDKNVKKFDEFNDPIKEKTERIIGDMRKLEELTGGACLMPNMKELYCNTCKWGFDIYIPPPQEAKHCPYCSGTDIVDRDPYWNSRLAIFDE
jgi:hypothetical protein